MLGAKLVSGDDIRALGVATTRDVLAFTPGATVTTAVADVSGISLPAQPGAEG